MLKLLIEEVNKSSSIDEVVKQSVERANKQPETKEDLEHLIDLLTYGLDEDIARPMSNDVFDMSITMSKQVLVETDNFFFI